MRAICLGISLLLLTTLAEANELHLEFAQEGDPSVPRALILIHNSFETRESLAPFLKAWDDRSWARDQYCSVFTYEYGANGLTDLPLPEVPAQDLFGRIRSGRFSKGEPDPTNPGRRSEPEDSRQPDPTLKHEDLELLLVGYGYGGLVARETSRLARLNEFEVKRVAYIGTPLDGMPVTELVLSLTVEERIRNLGALQPLTLGEFRRLASGWWHLTELYNQKRDWVSYFAPAHEEVVCLGAQGAQAVERHPTSNVLYGRRYKVRDHQKGTDGFFSRPLAWAEKTGAVGWLKQEVLDNTGHSQLTGSASLFLLEHVLEQEVIHDYLARRQGIEEAVKGDGELPPIGVYWDERGTGQWRPAYASKKGLYELMWGVTP